MARKNAPAFAEIEDDVEVIEPAPRTAFPQAEEPAGPSEVTARVKGSWTMFWGSQRYEFVDGKRYKLPRDLYEYLRSHSNIYDTL